MMFKFWKKDSASEAYFEKFQSILTRMEAAMSDTVHSGSISCLILVQFLPYQQAALEAAQNVLLHTEEEGMWRFAYHGLECLICQEYFRYTKTLEQILIFHSLASKFL